MQSALFQTLRVSRDMLEGVRPVLYAGEADLMLAPLLLMGPFVVGEEADRLFTRWPTYMRTTIVSLFPRPASVSSAVLLRNGQDEHIR